MSQRMRFTVVLFRSLFLIGIISLCCLAAAAQNPPEATSATDSTRLAGTATPLTSKDEAEAAYYRAQKQKIDHDLSSKSELNQTITIILPFATGILGLVVASYTSLQNIKLTRSSQQDNSRFQTKAQEDARRAQQDNQFYEASKRLGDKDSAAVRAGAATTIAQLVGSNHDRPEYLRSAIHQFRFAAILESNTAVQSALSLGMETLAWRDPLAVLDGFYDSHYRLTSELIKAMGNVLIYNDSSVDQKDRHSEEGKVVLETYCVSAQLTPILFEYIIAAYNFKFFGIDQDKEFVASLPQEIRVAKKEELEMELAALGGKLATNMNSIKFALYAMSGLRKARTSVEIQPFVEQILNLEPVSHSGLRLPRLYLPEAQLRYTDLHESDLESSILVGADLRDANLRKSILRHAILDNTLLSDAKIAGADLEGVSLQGSEWWRMDFNIEDNKGEIDLVVLESLFKRFASDIPTDLTKAGLDVASPVAKYIMEQRNV